MASKSPKKDISTGKIYKDAGKDLWVCEVRFTDPNGRRTKKTVSSKTKKACMEKVRRVRDNIAFNSQTESKEKILFESFAENWMITTQKMVLKPTTYTRKEQVLRYQVYPYVGHIPVSELNLFSIQNMVNQLDNQGLTYSSIKKATDCIRQIVNYYCIVAKVDFNPLRGVQLPTRKRRSSSDIVFFSPEDCKKIIAAATSLDKYGKPVYRLGHAITVLIYTGMRVGELLGMRWKDVDFENDLISVTGNAVSCKVKGKYVMVRQDSPKTNSGYRYIPLTPPAKEALKKLYEITGTKEYVMTNELGNIFSYHHTNRMFHAILKRCNIQVPKGTGVHSLRHTFASLLFEHDTDVKTVSEILGHCETGITEDIYIHITNKRKALAMKNLGNFLE